MAPRKQKRLVSQREYARRRGISHTAVRKAIRDGRIPTHQDKIDPTEADRYWKENTDPGKPSNRITGNPRRARHGVKTPRPRDLTDGDGDRYTPDTGTAASYAKARAARELYQAQIAEMEMERLKGTLVNIDEVRSEIFSMGRKARDLVLTLSDRLVPKLVGKRSVAQIRRIIDEETARICEEISRDVASDDL